MIRSVIEKSRDRNCWLNFLVCLIIIFSSASGKNKMKNNLKTELSINLATRIEGMLIASAIADAMAGPHEGRRTNVSRKFLEDGGWIEHLQPYTPPFQHHWNVYSRTAPAGTFTDDNRLRLMICNAMIENEKKNPGSRVTRNFLARYVFSQYQKAFLAFQDFWRQCEATSDTTIKLELEQRCKESFLHLWFLWEAAKTATEVFIPDHPPIFSPPAIRIAASEWTEKEWQLANVASQPIDRNIKASYNQDCYARGEEMPFGLIALLPFAIYFPGDPVSAFHYILEVDFFDIGDADLYPAVICAVLADLLGEASWQNVMQKIQDRGLEKYVASTGRKGLQRIQRDINTALSISHEFKNNFEPYRRQNYIQFVKRLHENFAVGEVMMCTVDEMFSVTLAIMNYAPKDLRQIIEMGVNYGRDNDTVASIVACYGGAALGKKTIPIEWRKIVEHANGINFKSIANTLYLFVK